MAPLTHGEPDFQGVIGRTLADSTPSWPEPKGGYGKPNVVMIVLDDTGFAHLGCYGSTLATPAIDRLAAEGLRYTGFHTTALCSPTRACLMTGRNHHSVGMRGISNWNTGFPHMRGGITPHAATIAELLREQGYGTYAAGKWHLAPMDECSAAGPFDNWPLAKGFDRYYGFLQGETDQFSPELTEDNHHIDPPARGEDGYHVSEDLIDQSTKWIRDLVSVRPDRPFFLYLAFGAMHAPHQSPAEYVERWRGKFDAGYEEVRREWFARQQELGIVPEGTDLAPRNLGVPAWEELSDARQRFANRLQEAFAAMLEHTDDQIARLMAFLDDLGLSDNTVVMLLSDNGASQEGGPFGVMDEFSFFNGIPEDVDAIVANRLDDIGGPHSHSNYPWGWAQAGNSPLKWYKQNTYGGGVRDPLIIRWPNKVPDPGGIRRQFVHAIDLAATVLDIAGIEAPESFAGIEQIPMAGSSMTRTIEDPDAPSPRTVQYFEQMGHRGIYADGWKAVTWHMSSTSFDDDNWELYYLPDDFSECHNLAEQRPDKLAEMIDLWWQEAEHYGVLPLDDRSIELFGAPARPHTPHARSIYTYYPPISHIPADACPQLSGRPFTLRVDVDTTTGDRGVLYARGSHNVGHSFFLDDESLTFVYNALGTVTRISGLLELPPGAHCLEARFDRVGPAGTITLFADGNEVASGDVPTLVRILGSTGMDLGRDALSQVCDDYVGEFPFTGTIAKVTFELPIAADAADRTAQAAETFAKE
jgi:arylsulfatase A-like enzyme